MAWAHRWAGWPAGHGMAIMWAASMAWIGFEGNYGDPSYTYLLYDPDTQAFVENTAIQALIEMHSLSQVVDGQLEFWYRSGPCLRGEKSIRFEGQTPRIIARNDVNTCTDGLGDN